MATQTEVAEFIFKYYGWLTFVWEDIPALEYVTFLIKVGKRVESRINVNISWPQSLSIEKLKKDVFKSMLLYGSEVTIKEFKRTNTI